jgi:hypothetical protein
VAWRKFDRAAVSFGGGREYVVIGMHLVLDILEGVGCEPSFDERRDLNIAFKNHMKLRGLDQAPPR